MKKIIVGFFFIIILTGCTAKYELKIDNDNFEEKIYIDANIQKIKNPEDAKLFYELMENSVNVFNNNSILYNKKIGKKGNIDFVELNYNYSPDEFEDAYIFNNCFQYPIYINLDNSYYFELEGKFLCNYANKGVSKIIIQTDNMVIDNNADEINGNKYTWNIIGDNSKNKKIMFQVMKEEKSIKTEKSNKIMFFSVLSILLILSIAIILYIYSKKHFDKRFDD